MQRDSAEAIGAQALAWLVGNDTLFPVFLGSSGIGIDALRETAADPEILGAVLDFLLMDDAWIAQFCDTEGLAYDAPMRARLALPGGANTHWT